MIAWTPGNTEIGAVHLEAQPISIPAYLNALGTRIQHWINQIPPESEPEMQEMIQSYLDDWGITPTYQSLNFLGFGLVEGLADATLQATFARVFKADGTTIVMDLDISVTGGGGTLQLNTTNIVTGGPILVTSFIIDLA